MRRLERFVGRFGRHERNFTEAQIMKFTKHRDYDSLKSLVLSEPNFLPNTTLVDAVTTAEPEPQPAVAKGARA